MRFAYGVKAYDSHCNIVLGDVTETVYIVDDEDDENAEMRVRCIEYTLDGLSLIGKTDCKEAIGNAFCQRRLGHLDLTRGTKVRDEIDIGAGQTTCRVQSKSWAGSYT